MQSFGNITQLTQGTDTYKLIWSIFNERVEVFVHHNTCPITSALYLDSMADVLLVLAESGSKSYLAPLLVVGRSSCTI